MNTGNRQCMVLNLQLEYIKARNLRCMVLNFQVGYVNRDNRQCMRLNRRMRNVETMERVVATSVTLSTLGTLPTASV
jgi:hypothetical protein